MGILNAVTGGEVRRQLTSPITWIAVAIFALISGLAFVLKLDTFLDASLEVLSAPALRPVNVNQLLIRPFLDQVGIAALLVLPIVTARVFWTDSSRRTVEGTHVGRVAAPFVGVLAVYKLMLAASLLPVLALFVIGRPEWGPIVSGYVGLLAVGAAFIAVALFISSLATSPFPAAAATLALSLSLAAASYLAQSAAPAIRPFFERISIAAALDDFTKGVVDAGHIVTCLTIIGVALVLTAHLVRDPKVR
jgi:gliding motility-associated transport system permease protein